MLSYVLLKVKPGYDRKVLQELSELTQVKEAETVYGEYDLIVKVDIETLDDLDDFVFNTLRKIAGIEKTTTLLTSEILGEETDVTK
ncbi:Lrp/AsnC family transcriptional regulator [Candidatus Bathyarchaeota archaeon]|nr:MAG: Lrp/AsnC family transcriptional regulator [Candidatus Bathyarchaeota archaeon]